VKWREIAALKQHRVRTFKSAEPLARADQLAWKIAEVAADPITVEREVTEMISNRITTSHHTHYVIGAGANDPQKMDPNASRETGGGGRPSRGRTTIQAGKLHPKIPHAGARRNRA
jgi:hypothetical protein